MKPLKLSYCSVGQKPCVRWVAKYFKDCLCNLKDEISFAFGIASLVCWAVAEIPQIITNFKSKSADGVSLAFISTWIVGDVFNLVGCILEPATLPTQFYTAVLYAATTVVLALQCIYYDHIIRLWKGRKTKVNKDYNERSALKQNLHDRSSRDRRNAPIEVPRPRWRDFHFRSARSLAGSDTPPIQSYIKPKSGPPALEHQSESSSEDEEAIPPEFYQRPVSQPRLIPGPAGYGTFLAASAYIPRGSKASQLYFVGRRLLEEKYELHGRAYGQWLGWLMAAIYMGGRIPQIWLNIKRGSVEGLNPLMFLFALIANATYVGSILVRSSEWEKIQPNMPWLLDAVVCVALDLFIILQYIFYRFIKPKKSQRSEEHYEDCGTKLQT
ncbi:vacuolar lysine transporter YPQ1-like isoform X3 [Coffea arabica]|uniref:Vacuolar lysine transporter YPQ1-like isoform X3 n=1 Tax=Coffea arabica TaxID=13443 RepID=A0A6P6ULY9_COFAR